MTSHWKLYYEKWRSISFFIVCSWCDWLPVLHMHHMHLMGAYLAQNYFLFYISSIYSSIRNRIGGVIVNVRESRVVDSRSGQTKNYKIGICSFPAKHAPLRRKRKTGWLGIKIMCPSGATCLSADCCFSELAL